MPTKIDKARLTAERENAERVLTELFAAQPRFYTLIIAATNSGNRRVKCFAIDQRNSQAHILEITYFVARMIGATINQNDGGLVVTECGTDAGHVVAHSLRRAMALLTLQHVAL